MSYNSSVSFSSMHNWITPQEQLMRLAMTSAKEQLRASGLEMIPCIVNACAEAILMQSNVLQPKNSEIPSLKDLVTERLIKEIKLTPLPSILTDWYKAREKLNILPEKIPALPADIFQIVRSRCPTKPDGTPYTISGTHAYCEDEETFNYVKSKMVKSNGAPYQIWDTHVLHLLCEEDGTLNHFEENIIKPYGIRNYPEGKKPVKFWYSRGCEEYGNIPFEVTHWELTMNDVLSESRSKTENEQVDLMRDLNEATLLPHEFSLKYEVPSLMNISRTFLLHKVATGKTLYPTRNSVYTVWREQDHHTLTRVQELIRGDRLVVGDDITSFGVLSIHSCSHDANEDYGLGAVHKFR